LYEVLVHRLAGFVSPSFGNTVARASLASAGAYLFISVHFDFHTGDLNPIRTAPMLGTHKTHRDNPCQPFSFDDFP
jgi:hypothetical protein